MSPFDSTSTSSGSIKQGLILMSCGLLVAFAILEVVARIVLPAPLPWLHPQVSYRAHPELTFALAPNQQAYSADKAASINERGLRGALVPYEKPEGVRRLLFLGDSITFGFGVDERDIVTTRVSRLLAERAIEADVVNSGVPAYNTRQEVDYLELEGLRYRPDWVILGFYWNDLGRKEGVQVSSDGFLLSEGADPREIEARGKLWTSKYGAAFRNAAKRVRFLYGATRGLRTLRGTGAARPNSQLRADLLEGRSSEIVEDGWKQVEASLRRLRQMSKEHGFCSLLVAFPLPLALEKDFPDSAYPAGLRKLAAMHRLPILDLEPVFRDEYAGHESLFIAYDGDHPNAAGHAVAARAIADVVSGHPDGCPQPQSRR